MVKEFSKDMAVEVEALIRDSFNTYVGNDYTEQGRTVFFSFANTNELIKRHDKGNIILVYQKDKQIQGMIEARDHNHICLFFIHPDFQGQGIGRQLYKQLLSYIKDKTSYIEVNSSVFALPVYEKLGFVVVDELQEVDGIQFVPMKAVL